MSINPINESSKDAPRFPKNVPIMKNIDLSPLYAPYKANTEVDLNERDPRVKRRFCKLITEQTEKHQLTYILASIKEKQNEKSFTHYFDAVSLHFWIEAGHDTNPITAKEIKKIHYFTLTHINDPSFVYLGSIKNLEEKNFITQVIEANDSTATPQKRAEAQVNLGISYATGKGIEKSKEKAVHYFKLAADQGLAMAQLILGTHYVKGKGVEKSEEKAVHYFKLAADQGHAQAQNNLGFSYAKGKGVEKSEEKAVQYYKLAADQGHAQAQNNLGVCYAWGKGVEKSEETAVQYYKLAADRGNAQAQNNLGVCYAWGKGVEKSEEKAEHYYKLAAAQGHKEAQEALKAMHSSKKQRMQ